MKFWDFTTSTKIFIPLKCFLIQTAFCLRGPSNLTCITITSCVPPTSLYPHRSRSWGRASGRCWVQVAHRIPLDNCRQLTRIPFTIFHCTFPNKIGSRVTDHIPLHSRIERRQYLVLTHGWVMADSSRWQSPASQLEPQRLIGPASFYFLKHIHSGSLRGISCKVWNTCYSESSTQLWKLKPKCRVSNLGFTASAPHTGAWPRAPGRKQLG